MTIPTNADPQLERNYLALVMRARIDGYLDSEERCVPADMFFAQHAAILQALHDHYAEDKNRNSLALVSILESRGLKDAAKLVEEITYKDITVSDVAMVSERLRVLSKRRRERNALAQALVAHDDNRPEDVPRHLAALNSESVATVEIITAKETAERAIEELINAPDKTRGRTGFPAVDDAIGGPPRKCMMVLGGPTSSGKSSVALGMAMNALKQGRRPAIISLEDAEGVWGPRYLAHVCGINDDAFHGGKVPANFYDEAERGLALAASHGLYFGFALNRPLKDVLAAIRKSVTHHKCNLIVVDYIQAITFDIRAPRHIAVANAAQTIKSLCQEMDVPLIMLSQLSRPDKQKPFAEPNLSWFKESGDIENMTEIALLIWKDGDGDDANTFGKVAKVKWSPKRPRFIVQRDPSTGAVVALVYRETPRGNPLPDDDSRYV